MNPTQGNTLYIRDRGKKYQEANPEQVLQAARAIVASRVQRGTTFKDPSVAKDFFRDRLSGHEREVFAVAFLDTRHRLIEYAELFFGTIDEATVHPREVVRHAIRVNAAAVIVGHNHPSGDMEPSAADRALTARLKQALSLVDVRLLEHIIVGGQCALSMAGHGLV